MAFLRCVVRAATLATLAVPRLATAQSADTRVESLTGIHTVSVTIEHLGEYATAAGLDSSAILTQVQLKLREHGLTVTDQILTAQAVLYLAVNVTKPANGAVAAIGIDLFVEQNAYLQRAPKRLVPLAITWFTATALAAGTHRVVDGTRTTVSEAVDEFLNDWLSVNPPRSAKQ